MDNNSLRRQLSPMHVWAIAFGCVIGWGSFINPGKKFLPNSGVAGTTIAMILGALVMIIIAFSYAYMVPKYPNAGGEFSFAKNTFGKHMAFLCGWFLVVAYLTNVPMNSTAIGLIVDGLDGSADILKFGFHYNIAGFDIYGRDASVHDGADPFRLAEHDWREKSRNRTDNSEQPSGYMRLCSLFVCCVQR